MHLETLRQKLAASITARLEPLSLKLAHLKVTPNHITWAGLTMSCVAAVLILQQNMIWAGFIFLFASSLDLLDGALARASNQVTRFGGLLDSTLDRVSEGVVFAAIAYVFAVRSSEVMVAVTAVTALTSMLVSYVRARAEGIGISCNVGIVARPERVLVLTIGLLFDALTAAVCLVFALSAVTLLQRLYRAAQVTQHKTPDA